MAAAQNSIQGDFRGFTQLFIVLMVSIVGLKACIKDTVSVINILTDWYLTALV